jgi:hypothetical protein
MQPITPTIPALDAYLHWAVRTSFSHYRINNHGQVTLLVRFAQQLDQEAINKALDGEVLIAQPYVGYKFATAYVAAANVPSALAVLRDLGAEACELASPLASIKPNKISLEHDKSRSWEGSETVIGVIDDGCPFAHIGARGSPDSNLRVRSIWDQGGEHNDSRVGYGRFYDWKTLNGLLNAAKSADTGNIDENVACEISGLPSLRGATSHGAQVLSHAIGYAPAQSPAADVLGHAEVAFVQLPPEALDDPSGGWLSHYALDGIHHICSVAREHCKVQASTVIVNLSYGPQTGPHDGSSNFEMALGDMIAVARAQTYLLRIVVPSGNGHLGRAHGEFDLGSTPRGGSLDWCVAVDSQAPSYLELWLPDGVSLDDLELTLTAPDGALLGGQAGYFVASKDDTAAVISPPGSRMVLLFVAPTAYARNISNKPMFQLGTPGRWTVTVIGKADKAVGGTVHAYLARRDPNMGRQRRGRSGYLDSPTYDPDRFWRESEQLVRPAGVGAEVVAAGSMNGIGTSAHTLVVAGNRASDDQPSRYSAGGPTRGARVGPDYSYDTDESRVFPGIACGGNRSATVSRLVGTSVAAPQCARELATAPGGVLPQQRIVGRPRGQPERVGRGVRRPRGEP